MITWLKLSQRETRRLQQGLCEAIDSRRALIDAHTTEIYIEDGIGKMRIPKEHKPICALLARDIKAWQKLRDKLRS